MERRKEKIAEERKAVKLKKETAKKDKKLAKKLVVNEAEKTEVPKKKPQ